MIGARDRRLPALALALLSALAVALLSALAVAAEPPYEPPHDRPGPAVERLAFRAFHVDRAPLDLRAGSMDLYLYGLRTDAALDLRGDPAVRVYASPATTLSLVLNPAPAPSGRLNPFALPEVRWAMQFLVDRDFIAQDLFRGLAVPMRTHVSPLDHDYLTVFDLDRGAGVRYDPEYARALIAAAMTEAGATLEGERWHYAGQPLRLRLVARVEDERRDIGDLVRAELERAGFEVAMAYQTFAPAVLSVYSTDPAAFEWHVYTEGWGRSAPQRYDVGTVNAMNAPWLGNMPGWREVGFWQYEHPELDELGQRLFRGEFASREERDAIYRAMTRLGLEASVRVWLVTATTNFAADADLRGVTADVVAGPRSPWTLREAHVPGRDDLVVGHLWVWTERTTWNPVAGFGDVYGIDVWRNLSDPPLWNHPFTGVPQPFRARYEVETAGPMGSLALPEGTMLWDVAARRWAEVPPGSVARSRVTFDYGAYFGSRWHHGEAITPADLLYPVAQAFDLAFDPDRSRIETALAVTSRPYLETIRGYRLLDDDRLEVYVDFWHFDDDSIAAYASPASLAMPWEVLAALDDLVFAQRRAAYSDTAAARFNVPWISLVMSRDARLVERTLRQFETHELVPEGVFRFGERELVSADEARARYRAALAWFASHGHLVIANGPFWLARYDPPAQYAELHAFRDEGYPFRPGERYLGEAEPLRVSAPADPEARAGAPFELDVRVEGPGVASLHYLLLDAATTEVVASGEAEALGAGEFRIALDGERTRDLFPGLHHLHLVASSDALALVLERRLDLEVVP